MDPRRLQPHPANTVLPELDSETYEALKADIAEHGIQVAVMITPTFTIIAGHHRVRAAVELGLEAVPVAVHDVDDTEAERLLIADNLLRRQITDPMAKARLIRRFKELHEIRQGARTDLVRETVHKTSALSAEVAAGVGLKDRQARNLYNLTKLIPELQALVSEKRLSVVAGAALASLSAEDQRALWDALGTAVAELKAADVRDAWQPDPELARLQARLAALQADYDAAEAARDAAEEQARHLAQADQGPEAYRDLTEQLAETQRARAEAESRTRQLKQRITQLEKATTPRVVERLVEKVVADPQQTKMLAEARRQLAAVEADRDALATQAAAARADDSLDRRRADLQREITRLERELGAKRTGLEFMAVGRRLAQALDRDWATLQGLVTGELDGVFWPEVMAWSERFRQVAAWLDHVAQQPQAARVIDIDTRRVE
ncbi:MAG: ParB/RepB/Spo0J family partition protein [Clostridia bacterium]